MNMVGYKKLALVAAAVMALGGAELMAAPMTEPAFILYHSRPNGIWNRSTNFLMHFVHWSESNPECNVRNISWVERYFGENAMPGEPIMVYDPEADHGRGAMVDDRIPAWKRANIPEPSTALLVGGAMGVLALRRRMM